MFRIMLIAGLAAACWTTPTRADPGVAAQVEAAERAFAAGLIVVMNRCPKMELSKI